MSGRKYINGPYFGCTKGDIKEINGEGRLISPPQLSILGKKTIGK